MRTVAVFAAFGVLVLGAVASFSFSPSKQPTPVKTAPLAYFSRNCARCHGYYGANYGKGFGKGLSDQKLRKVVDDMASGPGGTPLHGADLDALVAFHRSIVKDEPFLAWTGLNGSTLSGEKSPDANVSATVGGKALKVKQGDTSWSLDLPAGTKAQAVRLTATLGKKIVSLDLAKAAWSHGTLLTK